MSKNKKLTKWQLFELSIIFFLRLFGFWYESFIIVVTSRPVDKSAGDWGEASSTGLARFGDWREYMHGLSVAAIELSLKM